MDELFDNVVLMCMNGFFLLLELKNYVYTKKNYLFNRVKKKMLKILYREELTVFKAV